MRRTIREMTEQLMGLGDEAWGHYAFFHEPLERKLSKEQKASYTKLAMKCGREEGVLLKTANPQKTVLEITRDMGIRHGKLRCRTVQTDLLALFGYIQTGRSPRY